MLFKEVIGQQAVKQRLIKSASEGRVSHALLFLGAEGSGNLALAIAYAQYLVCENNSYLSYGETIDSCGICPACLKLKKLVHPDITFSYPVAPVEGIKNPRSVDFVQSWRKMVLDHPY